MTVSEFLLHRTKVGDVCIIAEYGYDSAYAVIDHEDLFIAGIAEQYRCKTVLNTKQEQRPWAVKDVAPALC